MYRAMAELRVEMSEWRKTTIDQLGRIVTGKTPPSTCKGCFGGDIPFITPSDMDGRRYITHTGRYLTNQGVTIVGKAHIPANAIMVSCIGSDMGKVAIAGQSSVSNQQINSIIVETDDFSLYIYYELSTRKTEIRNSASGSAQPILNKSAFGRLPISLPIPEKQRAIAHILGTLDNKIELNRRMNETLEAMAQAIFKSWFVDFDPVCAKMNGELLESICNRLGLTPELFDLFPDRLQDFNRA
jgi:type I restriction enzyme, S subunit